MAIQIPAGYAGVVPLTIANPSSTLGLGGSTTVPVGATAQDYVVTCPLSGGQAAAVYSGAQDQTAFTDVTAWWTDSGGAQHQIDVDYDTTTNGAWSAAQVTLRFRLQAPIAAGGSDAAYFVAFGHAAPVVARTWANLYPFWDTFAGTALASTKWQVTAQQSGTTYSVNDGLTMTSATGGGGTTLALAAASPYRYGAGYMVEALAAGTPLTAGIGRVGVEFGSTNVGNRLDVACDANGHFTLHVVPASGSSGSTALALASDSAVHWWRVARDPAANAYGYVDAAGAAASVAAGSTALPVALLCWRDTNPATVTLVVQWIKVRPWNGPGTNYTITPGAVAYRSGTPLGSTPSAGPLVRAGVPSIVRRDSATWLALYSDGTHALSRSGASVGALAAAADQTAQGTAAGVRGAALLADGAGTVVAVVPQTGGAPAAQVYAGSPGAWASGAASGLPSGAVFAGDTDTDSGSGQTSWHLLSALPGGTSIQHWVATSAGGTWTALSSANVVALPSSDPCLALAGYAGHAVAVALTASGQLTYAVLDALGSTTGGSAVAGSTLGLSGSALQASENLALLNSLENGAGDLYVAYNNGVGLCVRVSVAGGPLSWSAETQVSTTAQDTCPTLVRDDTGAVTLFWIGGQSGSGNPVLSQRLQVVGGTLYLTGATATQTNYAATRSLLSCVPAEPSGLVGLIWLES